MAPTPCVSDCAPTAALEQTIGRPVIAVCGMPRAGTSFLCQMVYEFGGPHGLFTTPLYAAPAARLQESPAVDALVSDPSARVDDLGCVLRDILAHHRLEPRTAVVCKHPHLVWRPDLLQGFTRIVFTVRAIDNWLQSVFRYRDTLRQAIDPPVWLTPEARERLAEYRDGDFVAEYGRLTRQQVFAAAASSTRPFEIFEYGEPAAMARALDSLGLPGLDVLRWRWTGSRWRSAPISGAR